MKEIKELCYCPNSFCSEFQVAKYVKIIHPHITDEIFISDLLRCEECKEKFMRISDIDAHPGPLFS